MEKKKLSPMIIIIIVIGSLALLVFLCALVIAVFMFFSAKKITPTENLEGFSKVEFEDYLGYQEVNIEINDNSDLSNEITKFYENVDKLAHFDEILVNSANQEDPTIFFDTYQSYNEVSSEMLSQLYAIDSYMNDTTYEEDNDAVGFNRDLLKSPLIKQVSAKERFSYWYYVPIIGSLIKGKHQSIEYSRSDIYNYLKNELTESERNVFINDYKLGTLENLKNADDKTVESLARDPELRGAINWTNIATKLGENAVYAVAETYKIVPSRTPLKTIATNGAFRVFTKPGDEVTVNNTNNTSISEDNCVSLMISETTINAIDNGLGEYVGERLVDIPVESIETFAEKMLGEENNTNLVVAVTSEDDQNTIKIEADNWQILTSMLGAIPVEYNIEIKENQTTEIEIPYEPIEKFLFDKEITSNLGFEITPKYSEMQFNSCLDINGYSTDATAEGTCLYNYNTCKLNPNVIGEGYSKCISAGGGCWDIGRWEYIDSDNCPIDSNNNLNYDDKRLQSDYEYFGDGNRAYCECIVECREQHWTKKDCSGELRSCCEKIAEEDAYEFRID